MRTPRKAPPQFVIGQKMSKKMVSQEDVVRRMAFIEGCLTLGMSVHHIVAQAGKPPPDGLGIGQTATQNYIRRVRDRWVLEAEASRGSNKAEAVARLTAHMRAARGEKKWQAVAAFERLISDIQGTREPLRIDLNVNVNAALMHVIGNMSADQRECILAEYEEIESKAQAFDTVMPLGLPHKLNGGTPH